MAAKKTKAESDQAKDEAATKLMEARIKGHRDGVIEGLASAIRILLAGEHRDAAKVVRSELVRRFPRIEIGDVSSSIDRDMLNMIYRSGDVHG